MFDLFKTKEPSAPEPPEFEITGGEFVQQSFEIKVKGVLAGYLHNRYGLWEFAPNIHHASWSHHVRYSIPIDGDSFNKINEKLKELNNV